MPALGWDSVTVPGAVHRLDDAVDEVRIASLRRADGAGDRLCARRIPGHARHGRALGEQAPRFEGFPEFARVFLPMARAGRGEDLPQHRSRRTPSRR